MNSYERERRLMITRQMRSIGVPLRIPEDDEPASAPPAIGLTLSCPWGKAVQLNEFYYSLELKVKVIVNRQIPFYVSWFEIELPWAPVNMRMLSDPAQEDPPRSDYTFCDFDLRYYRRHKVLNHKLGSQILRYHPFGGYLLWMAEGLIPEKFGKDGTAPALVFVSDQFGHRYSAPAALSVKPWRAPTVVRKRLDRDITGARSRPRLENTSEALSIG